MHYSKCVCVCVDMLVVLALFQLGLLSVMSVTVIAPAPHEVSQGCRTGTAWHKVAACCLLLSPLRGLLSRPRSVQQCVDEAESGEMRTPGTPRPSSL
jgi:hypothetical protein